MEGDIGEVRPGLQVALLCLCLHHVEHVGGLGRLRLLLGRGIMHRLLHSDNLAVGVDHLVRPVWTQRRRLRLLL